MHLTSRSIFAMVLWLATCPSLATALEYGIYPGKSAAVDAYIDVEFREHDGIAFARYKLCEFKANNIGFVTPFDPVYAVDVSVHDLKEGGSYSNPESMKLLTQMHAHQSHLFTLDTPLVYDTKNQILCAYFLENLADNSDQTEVRFEGKSFLHVDPSMTANFEADDQIFLRVTLLESDLPLIAATAISGGVAKLGQGIVWVGRTRLLKTVLLSFYTADVYTSVSDVVSGVVAIDKNHELSPEAQAKYMRETNYDILFPTGARRYFKPYLGLDTDILDFADRFKKMLTRVVLHRTQYVEALKLEPLFPEEEDHYYELSMIRYVAGIGEIKFPSPKKYRESTQSDGPQISSLRE